MIPQVRKRGDLWLTRQGQLTQSHATFRQAVESIGAVRRVRQQVKNREERWRELMPKNSVTVTKRCGYNACRKLSSDESNLGLCYRHDKEAQQHLSASRAGTPRPQKKGFH